MPFAYLAQIIRIIRITSVRSSSRFNLAYTLRRMAPTPHAVMLRNQRMWLKISFTSVGLSTLDVYYKSTWNVSQSKNACLVALVITFCNIVTHSQMPHQVVFGCIGCITPINKFGPILCLVHTFYGNQGKGNDI